MNIATGTNNSENKNKSMQNYNGEEITLKIERNNSIQEVKIKPTEIKSKNTGIYLDENCKIISIEKGSSAEKYGLKTIRMLRKKRKELRQIYFHFWKKNME